MSCMMLFLALLPVQGTASSGSSSTNPAAWIAVQRDCEREHGRDAWSWQELSEARAAVFDPVYTVPKLPGWLHETYLVYLKWYPALLAAVLIAGAWLAWRRRAQAAWMSSLLLSIAWLLALWLMLLPTQTDTRPVAIVKMHGITLRQGNGLSYGYVMAGSEPVTLAAGVEAHLLAERSNGWVQVQLRDGTRGWVPLDAVYVVGWQTE